MKRSVFTIAGLLASFALGYFINSFIQKLEITRGESIEDTVLDKEDGTAR